jgi:hypothetical protein
MTVEEMLDELAERLAIKAADGELTEEDWRVLNPIVERVNKEATERGYVTNRLTPEQMAMEWEDFIAMCQRNVKQS